MYRNSIIYLISASSTILINFISLPLFTKYLDLSDYGTIAIFILFGTTLTSLLSLGLSQSLFRFYFKYSFSEIRILYTSITITLLLVFLIFFFVIIYPFSNFIINNIFNNNLSSKLLYLSFFNGMVIYFFNYNKQLLIAEKRSISVSSLIILQGLSNFLISFTILLNSNLTYLALIYGAISSNIISVIISIIINKRYFILKVSFSHIKKALIYSYPETPGLVIQLLYSSFDKVMITNSKGMKETGLYDFGFRFATILKIIMDSFSNSWGPVFMKTMQDNQKNEINNMVKKYYQLFFIFGLFAIGITYYTEELLIILTNDKFYAIKYIVPLLVIYYFTSTFSFMSIQQIYFSGKLIYNLPVNIIGLGTNLILNIFLIPKYGAFGAVLATISASSLQIIMNIYIGNKLCKIEYNLIRTIKIFLLITFIILLIYPIMFFIDSYIIKFIIKLIIISLYILYIIYFKLISIYEIYNDIASRHK